MLDKNVIMQKAYSELHALINWLSIEMAKYDCIDDCVFCEYQNVCQLIRDLDDLFIWY